jgi:hypothetical protein
VNQISGSTPTDAPVQAQDDSQATDLAGAGESPETGPGGFGSRGRARRRARFLRKARELAYRDLGGLVFNLHRFGARNDALVLAKLTTLGQIDGELRSIEAALEEREPVTVLREAGITACPRCAAIHSSEDRFCPNCGLSMSRHVDLPVAGAASPGLAPSPAPQAVPPQAAPSQPVTPQPVTPQPAPTPPTPPGPSREAGSDTAPPTAAPVAATPAPLPSSATAEEATEIIRPGTTNL